MGPSYLKTLVLPQVTTSMAPLLRTSDTPLRVQVFVGGDIGRSAFFSYGGRVDALDATTIPQDWVGVPARADRTLIMGPRQVLYGATNDNTAMLVSLYISEALPFEAAPSRVLLSPPPEVRVQPSLQVQAVLGSVEVSFDGKDWIRITSSPLVDLRAYSARVFLRVTVPGTSVTLVGTTPAGRGFIRTFRDLVVGRATPIDL